MTARPAGDAGGYSYDASSAGDATAAVPPYPAPLTEPVGGTAKTSTSAGTASSGARGQARGGRDEPGT